MLPNGVSVLVLLTLLFSGCPVADIQGQNDPPLRLEVETETDEASFRVMPCGEQGFALFYESTLSEENKKIWIFVFYDTDMRELWRMDIPLREAMDYRRAIFADPYCYFLFQPDDKKKHESFNLQIAKLDIREERFEVFGMELPEDSRIADLKHMDESLYLGLNHGEKCSVIRFDTRTRASETIGLGYNDIMELEDLYIDPLRNLIWVVTNHYVTKGEYFLYVRAFRHDGTEDQQYPILPPAGRKFNTARMALLGDRTLLIIGTFDNTGDKGMDSKEYFQEESTGFFTKKIIPDAENDVRFYNFLEFENLTGYLRADEFLNARKKATKKGTESTSLDYDLLIHDIIEYRDQFYFLAEGYYEEYHTVTNTYYDYYGRPMPLSYSVFDGYRYFNAFLSCFDREGNKLWDNGMEIFNILTSDLKKRINIHFDNGDIILAYNREGKIASKIISKGDPAAGVEYFAIDPTYINDRIMDDMRSTMTHWYGSYFLCYGFQTIRNASFAGDDKRTVFYINKVVFE